MKAGFHMPRVTSAEKQLAMVTNDAGKKSARSLRPEIKKKREIKLHSKQPKQILEKSALTTQYKFLKQHGLLKRMLIFLKADGGLRPSL